MNRIIVLLVILALPSVSLAQNTCIVQFQGVQLGAQTPFVQVTPGGNPGRGIADFVNGITLPLAKVDGQVRTYAGRSACGFPITVTVGTGAPLEVYVGVFTTPNGAAGVNGKWTNQAGAVWDGTSTVTLVVEQTAWPAPLTTWITNWPKNVTVTPK